MGITAYGDRAGDLPLKVMGSPAACRARMMFRSTLPTAEYATWSLYEPRL